MKSVAGLCAATLLLISVTATTLYVAMVAALASGLPFALSLDRIAVSVTATMAAGVIPISYFNLGSREAVLLLLFQGFDLRADQAIAFSLLFVLCYVILIAESAMFWLLARRSVYAGHSSAVTAP